MKNIDSKGQIVIYQDSNDTPALSIRLENETLWLTQKQLAELFGVGISTINEHIKNIFEGQELDKNSTIRNFRIVQSEGKREVSREIEHYNLDMIISVGYRVNSKNATKFRQWASKILKEYIIKGFVLDSERLKDSKNNYFDELLEKLRDIRSSESRIYAQVLKIYATAIDYDKNASITQELFKTVQNKLHFAAHGNTASEVIYDRISSEKINLGLTNFKGKMPTKKEAQIAKNYLSEEELKTLNLIVSMYFDFAELAAKNKQTKTMQEHIDELNKFLQFNNRELLQGAGKISHELAMDRVDSEYKLYKQKTKEEIEILYEQFAENIKELK